MRGASRRSAAALAPGRSVEQEQASKFQKQGRLCANRAAPWLKASESTADSHVFQCFDIDEGISGTSTKKRDSFLRMIRDAKDGRFDFIITKEISRFSRSTLDSIHPEIELGSHNLLVSLARIGLGVACVTEEFSQSGLGRGVILPLKTDFAIPPRAVVMCTLRGVTPTSAAKRFMDFISESNRMAYDPGHSYHFTNG